MTAAPSYAARVRGSGPQVFVLAHGLGGDQTHWDPIAEHLAERGRVVTFDLPGSGECEPTAYSPQRHSSVTGFADDIALVCAQHDARGATFVGHSMAGLAGALAAAADPQMFSRLVTIGTSACYIDDPATGYVGGFTEAAISDMLSAVRSDFELWSAGFAPFVMMNAQRPELAQEFGASLRRYRPDLALNVFRATFNADFRAFMHRITIPTLVLQSTHDPAVPLAAAQWLADHIPNATLRVLPMEGHFPHVVDPTMVIAALDEFLDRSDA